MGVAEVREKRARRKRLQKADQRHEKYQQEHREAEKQALVLWEQHQVQAVTGETVQSVVENAAVDPTILTERQGRRRYTAIEMIAAIKVSKGLKSRAAKRLGCDWATVDKYCKDFPAVEQAYQETREKLIDLAESKFRQKIVDGFWPAIRFGLATVGKNRGYTERIEQVLIPRSEAIREFQSDLDRAYNQDVESGSEGGLPEGSD